MKSFTSAFLLKKKVPKVYANVGVMLSKTKFMADFVAYDIVALFLDIFANVLTFQTKGIEAAISYFPFCESFLFKDGNKLWVVLLKYNLGGTEEFFPVCHQHFNFFFR